MSFHEDDGLKWYTNAEELIASEQRREDQVRKRYNDRIPTLEHRKNKLERDTLAPTNKKRLIEAELEQQEATVSRYKEKLYLNLQRKQECVRRCKKLAEDIQRMEENTRSGDPSVAGIDYARKKQKDQESLKEYNELTEQFRVANIDLEEAIRSKRKYIATLKGLLEVETEVVNIMTRDRDTALYLWQEAVDRATKPWPTGREEREQIYLEDLRLFLEDEVPDTVNITPPGHRDDSRDQTANGPYIALRLENNPTWGRLYIQNTPEGTVPGFKIHYTWLPRGLQDIPENLFIELTEICYTEKQVAELVRQWVRNGRIQS